ncbi:LytR/AlgR family response regulator transcription factor [Aquimarina pacifica]|uniref:LytR/AlgR family response regulator transcription factor n=1 Tax=Aquimarina pacifica TaxID=1296415 RepID=UPI0004713795|nr:response regulator transcription factor [Aquimarina pacifica]
MKVIIVEDEPKAIELLKSYLNHFDSIELVATFRNGLKAFEFLSQEPIDLILLDINMPHISGISLSKILPDNVKVIFTTAYSEYAVESYEMQAVDYLVKPISIERFTKSISRVLSSKSTAIDRENQLILVKSGFETFRLESVSILYLEKDGNYMNYHCLDQKILARETIQESLEKLPDSFIQTHKSYIVNLANITSFTSTELTIGKGKIPISETYKNDTLKRLENNASR